jgi:hypothetical protein
VRGTACSGPAAVSPVQVQYQCNPRGSKMLQNIARSRLLPFSVAAAAAWGYANSESTVSEIDLVHSTANWPTYAAKGGFAEKFLNHRSVVVLFGKPAVCYSPCKAHCSGLVPPHPTCAQQQGPTVLQPCCICTGKGCKPMSMFPCRLLLQQLTRLMAPSTLMSGGTSSWWPRRR